MKTKMILIATALVLGSPAFALAIEFDPNLQNRYPSSTSVVTEGRNAAVSQIQAPVSGGANVDRAGRVSVGF